MIRRILNLTSKEDRSEKLEVRIKLSKLRANTLGSNSVKTCYLGIQTLLKYSDIFTR